VRTFREPIQQSQLDRCGRTADFVRPRPRPFVQLRTLISCLRSILAEEQHPFTQPTDLCSNPYLTLAGRRRSPHVAPLSFSLRRSSCRPSSFFFPQHRRHKHPLSLIRSSSPTRRQQHLSSVCRQRIFLLVLPRSPSLPEPSLPASSPYSRRLHRLHQLSLLSTYYKLPQQQEHRLPSHRNNSSRPSFLRPAHLPSLALSHSSSIL
jgi:hypothetical protein